jgi:hypothetical protein
MSSSVTLRNPHSVLKDRRSIKTASGELNHTLNLLPVEPVVPPHNFVNTGPGFEVFKDRRDRHPSSLQYLRDANLSGNAFHGGALGPIERGDGAFGELFEPSFKAKALRRRFAFSAAACSSGSSITVIESAPGSLPA